MENNISQPTQAQRLTRGGFLLTRFAMPLVIAGSLLLTSKVAQAQPENGKYYHIQSVNSQKYLGTQGKTESGEEILQVTFNKDAEGQQWKFVKMGKYYEITNKKSGKALNVRSGSTEEHAVIIQWDARPKAQNQQWEVTKNGDSYSLIARHSGMAMGIAGRSKEPGAEIVQLKPRKKAKNQMFNLVPAK